MIALPFADSVKAGLLASGWYATRLERDTFPGVLALCYHGIRADKSDVDRFPLANLHMAAETFDAHCRVIAETCHPIDLQTFCDAQVSGRALPDRPVLVTFDDGYRSVFELARPILLRYKIPAAVFVCSEPVRCQRLFWFDAVARAAGSAVVAALLSQPDNAWRRAADEHEAPAADAPWLAPMTVDQVRQLADEGFAIGVHGASHAPLARLSADLQRDELESCRSALESWTGHRVPTLAYPFGAPRADYTPETVGIATSLGFFAGFTTYNDFARQAESPLERSRFVVLDAVTAAELAHRMAYAWPR
jgi:peptidoglycan/xylan/chitin deacetylase (PgdA/CDA1 family)